MAGIIIYQMSGQNLDYFILEKKDYVTMRGKMQSIYQKNSEGFLIDHIDNIFVFEVKMKNKVIVTTLQIQTLKTDIAFFQLIDEDNTVLDSANQVFNQKFSPVIAVFQKSKKSQKTTQRIRITLSNRLQSHNVIVGIKYLLVRGEKFVDKNSKRGDLTQKNQKSKAFDSAYYDPSNSPHHIPIKPKDRERDNKLIFNDRKINKDLNNQEKQIKKAIQLSKKQASKNNKQQPMEIQNYKVESTINLQPRQYNTMDFDKINGIFSFVNTNWLEAQKKMEIEKGVKQSERLSSRIQVKHFHNKKVCVDLASMNKKLQLQKEAQSMGAKIIKEPEDYCVLVTNRVDTQRVSRGRKLKMVKIVNVDFIPQCKQFGGYLDEREYYLKL